jgi:hypothetical protein
MDIWNEPSWLAKYRDGNVIGRAQALSAYSEYYGLDGSGDLDPECEERLGYSPQPLTAYASRTGTKQNLDAMRKAGWRLLVSAAGVVRTEGFQYVSYQVPGAPLTPVKARISKAFSRFPENALTVNPDE